MSFNEQLARTKASFKAALPEEAQAKILLHVKEQQESGIVYGLREGDQAPNFSLANPLGEPITLYDELAKGPVVLVFYRGSWCPFCNVQIRAYQRMLPDLQQLGSQLIAISPQSQDNSLTQMEKEQLTFPVLSDPNGDVAHRYNLLFELPAYLQDVFKHKLGRDLALINQCDRWVLPVPATFLIDRGGVVRRHYVNPDYMNRMEPQEILDHLKRL
ncbi:peroxiredoxin-like family protein [Paenibacillus methanolicus]|uniref:thioredoxin-dependent peroxiredoxin n=1 Tax=Paenibacillus methanolicus TaxID=582686 RepID=A0A5S5BW75_9BACL|nr:peroxiredoxin-like family protein [Paenibacillus methanolicus]TYP71229.1 peroxiredoxin [Paenibacillus methanolicus]